MEASLVSSLVLVTVEIGNRSWLSILLRDSLLQLALQMVLVNLSVTVEELFVFTFRAIIACNLEAGKTVDILLINVDVLEFRWVNELLLSPLGHPLLVHLHFLLVFLHTNMDVVHQNITVDDAGLVKSS